MSFVTLTFVRSLSIPQREILIKHAPGPVEYVIYRSDQDYKKEIGRLTATRKMIDMQMIRGDHPRRPRYTSLTRHGREAVAMILAEYAEALISAGALEPELRPLEMLEKLKAADQTFGRSQTKPAKSPNLKNSTNPSSSSIDIGR